jgi:hypothetical protein
MAILMVFCYITFFDCFPLDHCTRHVLPISLFSVQVQAADREMLIIPDKLVIVIRLVAITWFMHEPNGG